VFNFQINILMGQILR